MRVHPRASRFPRWGLAHLCISVDEAAPFRRGFRRMGYHERRRDRFGFPQRRKPTLKNRQLIAAVNRCAPQERMPEDVSVAIESDGWNNEVIPLAAC
jgi:hypothetical protein